MWLLRQNSKAGHLLEPIAKLGIDWDFLQPVVPDQMCLTSVEHNSAQLSLSLSLSLIENHL